MRRRRQSLSPSRQPAFGDAVQNGLRRYRLSRIEGVFFGCQAPGRLRAAGATVFWLLRRRT